MLGDQFQRLKEGDRFWFENRGTYPNPFTDHIYLESDGFIRSIKISTLAGELVRSATILDTQKTLVLDDLHAGIYFMEVKTDKGSKVKRIVKR